MGPRDCEQTERNHSEAIEANAARVPDRRSKPFTLLMLVAAAIVLEIECGLGRHFTTWIERFSLLFTTEEPY